MPKLNWFPSYLAYLQFSWLPIKIQWSVHGLGLCKFSLPLSTVVSFDQIIYFVAFIYLELISTSSTMIPLWRKGKVSLEIRYYESKHKFSSHILIKVFLNSCLVYATKLILSYLPISISFTLMRKCLYFVLFLLFVFLSYRDCSFQAVAPGVLLNCYISVGSWCQGVCVYIYI